MLLGFSVIHYERVFGKVREEEKREGKYAGRPKMENTGRSVEINSKIDHTPREREREKQKEQ